METQTHESQVTDLLSRIAKQKRALMVWCSISLGLLSFLLISVALITSWTGGLPDDLWSFLLLGMVDIPFLIGTWKCAKTYNNLKKELKALGRQESPSGDYARNRKLLEQAQQLKFSLILMPILAVLCLIMQYGMFIPALCVLVFVVNFVRFRKTTKQIQESGVTEPERAAFTAETKKSNKTTGIILAVILVIVLIVVSSVTGGSGSSSSSKPWRELGVSEKEYMEIYNKYKYGE